MPLPQSRRPESAGRPETPSRRYNVAWRVLASLARIVRVQHTIRLGARDTSGRQPQICARGTPILATRSPEAAGWRTAVASSGVMSDNRSLMHLLERQKQLDELNRCFREASAASGKLVLVPGER